MNLIFLITLALTLVNVSARTSKRHYQNNKQWEGAFDWVGLPLLTLAGLSILYSAIMIAAYHWRWCAAQEDQASHQEERGDLHRTRDSKEPPVQNQWKLEIDMIYDSFEDSTVHDTELGQSTVWTHSGLDIFNQNKNYKLPAIETKNTPIPKETTASTLTEKSPKEIAQNPSCMESMV